MDRSMMRRVLTPAWFVTLTTFVRFRAAVSPRAEVEVTPLLELGRGVTISSFCKLKSTHGPVRIGANTSIASGCFIASGHGGLEIGEDCLVGPNCVLSASNYRYDRLDVPLRLQGDTSRGIRIGRNVQIAANCTVLDGADIGDNVIIGANSVIGGRLEANTIAGGAPARVLFTRR